MSKTVASFLAGCYYMGKISDVYDISFTVVTEQVIPIRDPN
ncbi:hypothetical protein CMALT394_10064 [Carnobacterium maltaromaticum]|nr:hypothetical protein CMALT394_10064 [Carnobacterium maltaromaticum]